MFIIQNDKVIQSSQASISPYDHGFLYGVGVFETFRTINGQVILLDEHFERLMKALNKLRIKTNITIDQVKKWVKSLLDINNLTDGYFRLNVSAGEAPIGLPNKVYDRPNVFLFVKNLPEIPLEKRCLILKTRRNSPEDDYRIKSHNYLNNIFGKYELDSDPSVEGIFLNNDNYIAEGLVSNIFFVKNNKLYTPSVDTGILEGITRNYIINMCVKNNLFIECGKYNLEFLFSCDEIFLCNSIQGIVPVSFIDERMYPGKSGVMTSNLLAIYNSQLNLS